MPTFNEDYFNSLLIHQLEVHELSAKFISPFISNLRQSGFEVNKILQESLPVPANPKSTKYKSLISSIREIRSDAFTSSKDDLVSSLSEFTINEVASEIQLLKDAIPLNISFNSPDATFSDISSIPFQVGKNQAATLDSLFTSIERADIYRLENAILLGLKQGKSIEDILSSVRGTRKAGFGDGQYSVALSQAESIVRTLVNHTSNTLRELTFEANSDIIIAKRWVATLDLRTSEICRYRDGRYAPVGSNKLPPNLPLLEPIGAVPPAHYRCRSVLVGLIALDAIIGERPFVAGEQVNFRSLAREKYGPNWPNLSNRDKYRLTGLAKQVWLEQNVGSVPATTTYYDWLKTLPAASQDKVLGPVRGALVRSGKKSINDLYTKSGYLIPVDQL